MRLSLRHTGLAPPDPNRGDYVVIDDGREVGRMHEDPYAPPDIRWFWSIIVIGAHQAGIRTNGRTATFEEAKEQFKINYLKWLVWAGLEVES
jgi:hypothetical protein